MNRTPLWRIRPAGDPGQGRQVPFADLRRGIENDDVGDLDEVLGPGESAWSTAGEHPRTSELLPRPRSQPAREEEDAETDLTPMIDVTFQLVIFFMIAATYTIQKTLDVPASQNDPPAAVTMEQLEQNNIIVRIAADGTVHVDGQPVEPDRLVSGLRAANRTKRSTELVLDVDDQAAHDVVVKVLDAASAASIEKVLFVSRAKS